LITALVVAETIALLLWVGRAVRLTTPSTPPHGRRLFAIATLLLAQAALLSLFVIRVCPGLRPEHGSLLGLAWFTQYARVAIAIAAFRLWLGMIHADFKDWRSIPLLAIALACFAIGLGPLPVVGFIMMSVFMGRLQWPRALSGWRRAVVLVGSALLLVALLISPTPPAEVSGLTARIAPVSKTWPPALVTGPVLSSAARQELLLTRPFDHAIEALLDLFRVQLFVLVIQLLTLPIRLSGMSLKRRFWVNYLLVRQIPGFIGSLALLVGAYLAFGAIKAGQARAVFERTLSGGTTAGAALLADPVVIAGGPGAAERLAHARDWIGPGGQEACALVRTWDAARDTSSLDSLPRPIAAVLARSPTAPRALDTARFPRTADGRTEGIVQAGHAIYLASRTTRTAPDRIVDVFVPLDSAYVAYASGTVGSRIELNVEPTVSVRDEGLTFSPGDTTSGLRRVAVTPGKDTTANNRFPRSLYLGRTFLPYGDWRSGWRTGMRGAISLELRAGRDTFARFIREVPGWLFSNIFTVGLLVALAGLAGAIEGLAVRSGRTIVQAIGDEVVDLRTAAARFGAGDLSHRVPVKGRDELSALAASFNDMAASLERQRTELVEKERLEEDLEVARQIQRRFLPQRVPVVPGLDVAGLSLPSREVGGDLYYYLEMPEGRLAVALGDVSGKSVPAALLMSNVMSSLRAEAQHEAEVDKSLERINRLVVDQIEPGRFVTLFYGIFDPRAGRLRYSSAGHNPVLRVAAGSEDEWLREGGLPIGVQADARYPAAEVAFGMGDMVVVYSDGVTEAEAQRGADIEQFGERRLVETVRALRDRPAEAVVQGILSAVQRFSAGRPQTDDVTLVVVRRV
jgi:serine phosphatase RsbU (regulator of sigma subunit)